VKKITRFYKDVFNGRYFRILFKGKKKYFVRWADGSEGSYFYEELFGRSVKR